MTTPWGCGAFRFRFVKRIAVVMFVVLAACGGDTDNDNASPSATSSPTTTTTTTPFSSTPVSTPENSEQGELTEIRTGAHDGFVRVVFVFSNLVPGYSVKPADPPFTQDGSGKEVAVAGNGHLAVRLIARAHNESGEPTAPAKLDVPGLGDIVLLGDFEGVVNYVIGTSEPELFKIFTLSSPARLVLDIQV
jgi:hypothetical protein